MEETTKAPRWLVDWQRDGHRRIEELRTRWRREREKLELELETTQLESSFSNGLVETMRKEEEAGDMGQFEAREALAVRVDRELANETARHFNGQADSNGRKLAALFRQQV
jgi:hypothetical protein